MSVLERLFGNHAAKVVTATPEQERQSSAKDASTAQPPVDVASNSAATQAPTKTAPDETSPANAQTDTAGTSDDPAAPSKTLEMLQETRIRHSFTAWRTFVGDRVPPLMFYGAPEKVLRIPPEKWGRAEDWFLLGDIHGDFYALSNIVQSIHASCPDFKLVFLGDLVDRGPHPMECLWFLLSLAKKFPDRILWLAGNHDVGVLEDKERGCFRSSVSPSEFLEHLNTVDSWTPFRRKFGQEYIELVAGLPRAVLSPDGLLMTHGGFPHTDLQKSLPECQTDEDRRAWLNSPQALDDFTWTRITRYRAKIPNRVSKGCQYGFADFDAFCTASEGFFPATRLVTGHDHPEGGVDEHPEWKQRPALTLTGFAFHANYDDPRAYNERYQQALVVGRCRTDDIPEVIRIPVDRTDLSQYFSAEIEPRFPKRS